MKGTCKKQGYNFSLKTLTHIIPEKSYNKRTNKKESQRENGQVIKSIGRMPWHQEPKKDVISCDKLRVGANSHRSADFRMGEPTQSNICVTVTE